MRDAAANDYAALMEVTFHFLASGQHSPSNSLIQRRVRDFVHKKTYLQLMMFLDMLTYGTTKQLNGNTKLTRKVATSESEQIFLTMISINRKNRALPPYGGFGFSFSQSESYVERRPSESVYIQNDSAQLKFAASTSRIVLVLLEHVEEKAREIYNLEVRDRKCLPAWALILNCALQFLYFACHSIITFHIPFQ